MTSTDSLQVSIAGDLWWNGFTAEVKVTNPSAQDLTTWSYSFESPHIINTSPWGAEITATPLENGLTRYTLTGKDWGAQIPAGQSITVGFNGTQGTELGNEGELSAALLFGDEQQTADLSGEAVITNEPVSEQSAMAVPIQDNGMDDQGMSHDDGIHQHSTGAFTDITVWGSFHDSNNNSEHNELVGGRTAITTEALLAYNGLRDFAGLPPVDVETVGDWAFANGLTNNSQAWGNDREGVGLWFAMQGAKVGWISDEQYDPQILADIQRTARLGSPSEVMAMVEQFGHEGFAKYLTSNQLEQNFINTLKMEPHYGGWMHARTHGFLDIEGVAIAHDIHHLTVLSWDQNQPFMNDTFDWPQWSALNVSDNTVINYFQGMVELDDPLSENLENLSQNNPETEEENNADIASVDSELTENTSLSDQGLTAESMQSDPMSGSPLAITISGDFWQGGFTASMDVINESDESMDEWGVHFTSSHQFYGEAWGVDVSTQSLGDGLYRYELTGTDWAQSLGAGQSVTVGFNALNGTDISGNTSLTSELLLAPGSELSIL